MDKFTTRCVVERKIVQLLIKGESFNRISKELRVGKVRVRKIKKMADEAGYLSGRELPPPPLALFESAGGTTNLISDADKKMSAHKDWIRERRSAGWHWVTIFEELPLNVSRASFYRFVKRHGLGSDKDRCRLKVIGEIIYAPGEALVLDWGKMRDVTVGGKKKTLWFLAGVMGHSRYLTVRLVWDNSLETTLNEIKIMFSVLGGIPRKLISDNPKCFSLEASKYEPLLNVGFERFASYYGTIPEILPPRSPEKKGKVERAVPYVRRIFESYGEWGGLKDAQDFLDRKLKIANERKHGTTRLRPVDVFLSDEVPHLGKLPPAHFVIEEYASVDVRKDGCVRFQNKYYSAGKEHIGVDSHLIATSRFSRYCHQSILTLLPPVDSHVIATSHGLR